MLALLNADPPRLARDQPEPKRAAGEALLSLRLAGVCDTDVQLSRGYLGYRGVLGHEFVADVVAADGPRWVGRRVVADINAGCGECTDCLSRDGHHCARRSVLGIVARDGALAERFVVPERCLVEVPADVSDERAVFAEPLAAALHVLDVVPPDFSHEAIVLGDGKLGLLVALALRSAGLATLVVGHHPEKLALARAAGARTLEERELAPESLQSPLVVEATGSERGVALALTLTAPRGTLVLKTTVAARYELDLAPVVIHELRVVGSRCGDLGRAVAALRDGLDPTPLIAARFPLERADEALRHASTRGVLKVLVEHRGPAEVTCPS
ncbi:MAG: alcohol dehydrogenase catalytic domain-containing protein [Polyangiaceae bacterium]